MKDRTFKKVKKIQDIIKDTRIDDFIKDYDGKGRHLVECKTGFKFENERTIDIGTVKEICDCINDYLEKTEN